MSGGGSMTVKGNNKLLGSTAYPGFPLAVLDVEGVAVGSFMEIYRVSRVRPIFWSGRVVAIEPVR